MIRIDLQTFVILFCRLHMPTTLTFIDQMLIFSHTKSGDRPSFML